MSLNCAVAFLLVASAQAFHGSAPIKLKQFSARELVMMPRGGAGGVRGTVVPQKLTMGHPRDMSAINIPYFTVKPDSTISWDKMGWCIEKSSSGDVAQINRCSGGPGQKWNWIPNAHGRNMIQLQETNKCLYGVDGAAIELRECGSQGTDSWTFEESTPVPAQSPGQAAEVRHWVMSLMGLLGVAALSVGAWLWQRRAKGPAPALSLGGIPLNVHQEDGLSMITPVAMQHTNVSPRDSSEPVGSSPLKKGGSRLPKDVLMSAAATVTAEPPVKAAPVEKFRKDYKQPNYWIREVQLDVKIFDGETRVEACLSCELNSSVASAGADLILDGDEDLTLVSLEAFSPDGELIPSTSYESTDEELIVKGFGSETSFTLKTVVSIVPEKNTQLSGLYYSGSMYCTQMEAEGFRRFTYFPDRPDVMAKYTKVRIEADKAKCPVLLGNGNKLEDGVCDEDPTRHFAVFEDPFAKPCYLFAIVAGDLGCIEDTFTTMTGRSVKLAVFSEHENVGKLDHAMESLKNSMKWDEERFGLEYDLDVYNVVAVGDFNMGAMENKGLNVFNTSCVLASPETATDGDYERVEGVIGHEYFHNWTGNRVTCRDWFQLTLKEGLTVFRDQEFSSDMGSPAVKRIEDVRILRAAQFREDGGPMSHPIRPESYIAMDNFYTATVYNKGAEVIRMYQTLLGRDGFRKGMDLYFERHDGSAVSCDDFRAAMADANDHDLSQFEEWYLQPGTPQVSVESEWDAAKKTYTLKVKQNVGGGQQHLPDEKRREAPMLIPIVVGLLDRATGKEMIEERVLKLTKDEEEFTFGDLDSEPVPSLLRNFSAPVKLEYEYSDGDLAFLAAYDTDSFNRWEAFQTLASKVIIDCYNHPTDAALPYQLPNDFTVAARRILLDKETADTSLLAYALALPVQSALLETMPPPIDPMKLHEARNSVRESLAVELRDDLEERYAELSPAEGEKVAIDGPNIGRRRLRNACLSYLSTLKDEYSKALCAKQFAEARSQGCMTDKLAALQCLTNMPDTQEAQDAIKQFFEDAAGDALVLDKWFSMQSIADVDDVLMRVQKLLEHPDFTLTNPNRLRSVIAVFASNTIGFHKLDGSGYAFLADQILEVDKLNPQIASRLPIAFSTWPKLDVARQELIKAQLKKLFDRKDELSKNTYEVVSKVVNAA